MTSVENNKKKHNIKHTNKQNLKHDCPGSFIRISRFLLQRENFLFTIISLRSSLISCRVFIHSFVDKYVSSARFVVTFLAISTFDISFHSNQYVGLNGFNHMVLPNSFKKELATNCVISVHDRLLLRSF